MLVNRHSFWREAGKKSSRQFSRSTSEKFDQNNSQTENILPMQITNSRYCLFVADSIISKGGWRRSYDLSYDGDDDDGDGDGGARLPTP